MARDGTRPGTAFKGDRHKDSEEMGAEAAAAAKALVATGDITSSVGFKRKV